VHFQSTPRTLHFQVTLGPFDGSQVLIVHRIGCEQLAQRVSGSLSRTACSFGNESSVVLGELSWFGWSMAERHQ